MAEFNVIKYAEDKKNKQGKLAGKEDLESFKRLCDSLRRILDEREGAETVKNEVLKRQNNALLGDKTAVNYYINKIQQILEERQLSTEWFPDWYKNLAEAIYHEGYGFAGFANWMDDNGAFSESSSCKILGERIYYDVDGELQLQEQKISRARLDKLRTTLLCADPKQIQSEAYHEVYSKDGKRIAIYNDTGMTKAGQPAIVFRRYLNNVSTFEAQADRHTIPQEAIELFKAMVGCGYNVAVTGPVKAGKSTFMTILQSHENETMEGLQIETDPENPLHLIMPKAPIMQLVPTGKYMDQVIMTAKRSDAQYVILGEARTGKMMNIAVEAADMGTRHSKVTAHTSETVDFSFDMADKITRDCGGDLGCNMIKVAKSFHYIYNFFSLPKDRKQKRLKGIWEMRYDNEQMKITMHQICRYRILEDDWVWAYDIGKDKTEIGIEEDYEAYQIFEKELKKLSEAFPNNEDHVYEPAFLKMWRKI